MATEQPGFFSQLGLPDETRAEMIQQRQREVLEAQQEQLQGLLQTMPENDVGLARAGFDVGNTLTHFLAKRGNKDGLTKEDRMQLGVKEDADVRMEEVRKTPEYQNASPEERNAFYLQEIANAASDRGMFDVASQAAMSAAQTKLAFRKQRNAVESQEQQLDVSKQQQGLADAKERRAQAGEFGAFVVPDANGEYTPFGVETLTGKIGTDGALTVTNQDGSVKKYSQFLTPDEYSTMVDVAMEATDGDMEAVSGMPTKDRLIQYRATLGGTTALNKQQEQIRAGYKTVRIMNDVADIFGRLFEAGEDPATALGTSGKIIDFTTNLRSTVSSVAGTFFGAGAYDPEDSAGLQHYRPGTGNQDEFLRTMGVEGLIQVPSDLQGEEAAKYRAAVVDLAYTIARANEPGARQLSDTDFKNALRIIGAESADPRKMMGVVKDNLKRGAEDIINDRERTVGVGAFFGFNEGEVDQMIYGGTFNKWYDSSQAVMERYESVLGGADHSVLDAAEGGATGEPAPATQQMTLSDGRKVTIKSKQ